MSQDLHGLCTNQISQVSYVYNFQIYLLGGVQDTVFGYFQFKLFKKNFLVTPLQFSTAFGIVISRQCSYRQLWVELLSWSVISWKPVQAL